LATPTNHWKLGLFVVLGIAIALGAVLILGARRLHRQTIEYESYFDESVQGLDVGSVVKFRGVPIGSVSKISVASDRRHVDVQSALGVEEIDALGLASGKGKNIRIRVPADLRMQLASAGITGVKFLQLDFFPDTKNHEPPALPFPVPENYIPVEVSTMKNLEDSVVTAVDQVPAMTGAALHVMSRIEHLMDEVDQQQIPDRLAHALTKFDGAFTRLDSTLANVDAARLSKRVNASLDGVDAAMGRVNGILSRIDGDRGMVASAQRASDAVGDAVSNVSGLGEELSTALRIIERAAGSVDRLSDALERDSDMLIKGRAKASR
jgi:phospholipid/cholesterol/gamma-HCH transport system substrate-binding protein